MLPDGYTTVTRSEETEKKLTELVVKHNLESEADAVDYAATVARDSETLSNPELARLLAELLAD